MKTRAVILAGGVGSRLGVLTAKRTKPAIPFAGKYRLIDFPLSNCVNSDIFDVVIIAQYRPHSLIDHIGSGAPWDLNRDFTGGVRIFTPYTARYTGWFSGTADAIQQNFGFLKQGSPDLFLILSGDHVYMMNYRNMIQFHEEKGADVTLAVISVPLGEAHRFGVIEFDENNHIQKFVEKPQVPQSTWINMGVYLFNRDILDKALWEDHMQQNSSHDFGKDILPNLIKDGAGIYAYPYQGYWVDVGTINSYWQAHMDLLVPAPPLALHDRTWIVHTRTEERPPVTLRPHAHIENSLICDGCIIESGAQIIHSVLSPGIHVKSGAVIQGSVILTDCIIHEETVIKHAILDKRVHIEQGAIIGAIHDEEEPDIAMVGKNSVIPSNTLIEPGGMVGADVITSDFPDLTIKKGELIQTRRSVYEI